MPPLKRTFSFLQRCFGRGLEECRCPPRVKRLCREVQLSDLRSPIVLRAGTGERHFGYTAIDNRLFRPWHLSRIEPPDAVKLTYCFLVSKAHATLRLVYGRPETLAQLRGIPLKTYTEHLKRLERLDLILRIPHCDLVKGGRRYRCIVLLDLPRGMARLSSEAEDGAESAWTSNAEEREMKQAMPSDVREEIVREALGEDDDDLLDEFELDRRLEIEERRQLEIEKQKAAEAGRKGGVPFPVGIAGGKFNRAWADRQIADYHAEKKLRQAERRGQRG